jgi:hypothetical protein
MQWFQNAYTRRLNARHRFWGHLFGGRYKAIPVENEATSPRGSVVWRDYVRTVIDYVHLNPGRAGLVDGGKRVFLITRGAVLPPVTPCRRRNGRAGSPRNSCWTSTASGTTPRVAGGSSSGSMAPRKSRNYRSRSEGPSKDHGEKRARGILAEAMAHYGMTGDELRQDRRGDWRRRSVAWALAKETSVPHAWIAEKLNLKSAANASQQICRFHFEPARGLPREVKA